MYTEESENGNIFIGRSEKENDQLYNQYKLCKNVIWFHLTDESSPHGFLVYHTLRPTREMIYRTAILVKKYSKMKKEGNVSVDYLPIQYVSKTDTIGTVELLKTPSIICA